uniref:Uncharacterized protein n=1 Tax=Anopheles coluzzii TaxID=1518534 RepID=A0A8W7PIT0_ANOCL
MAVGSSPVAVTLTTREHASMMEDGEMVGKQKFQRSRSSSVTERLRSPAPRPITVDPDCSSVVVPPPPPVLAPFEMEPASVPFIPPPVGVFADPVIIGSMADSMWDVAISSTDRIELLALSSAARSQTGVGNDTKSSTTVTAASGNR